MNIYLVPPALGFVVFLCLVLAALFKGSRRPAELLFAGFCLSGALINLDIILVSAIPDKATALQVDRTIYIFFVFSIPLYIRFIHVFLGESRPWLDGAALAVSILFLVFTRSDYFISGLNEYSFGRIARAGPLYHAFCFAGAMASVYCLVMLFKALRETEEGRQRNRLKFIIVGMGMSAFLLLLNYLPINGFSIYPMGNFVFVPAVIMAFGVLKYDLFDVDAAIRKGMVYFFLTGTIMVIYAFLFYILDIFFREFARSHILFSPFVLALTVIFLFDPVRKGVERFTDKHFFSGKYDYRRTLKEISEEMTLLLRYEDIRRFLVTSIENTVQVEDVRLVVPRDDDERSRAVWGNRVIFDVLERQKAPISKGSSVISRLADGERKAFERLFEVCGAVILFPVIFRGRLNGLITLGQKKSGELFVQEDLELLSTVANQCAVALENARAYEELQELNANLEEKVRERTAELERALREKENAQNRLIQSERLAAIGQLAAGVAHEINNPLASALSLVQTSVESMRRDGAPGGEGQDCDEIIDDLEFTIRELERVRDIIRSLLGLSRQTTALVESVNLNRVVEDALMVLRNQYKGLDVVIARDYQEDLPEIEGNYANLGQVVVNIVKNAIQALPKKEGKISVTTKTLDDGKVCFECRDNGMGIPPENIRQIFDPFFTTKEAGRGTGLGLYISNEIVRRHGGRIDVCSTVNEGCVFRVELPARQRRSPA